MKINQPHRSPDNYAMSHPSIAHTYGNIASVMTEYIRGLFQPSFFKTVHIHNTIAYKQIAIQRARNKEFFKKSKPMLIIRPRIEMNDNDNFLYGTLLTQRMTDLYYNRDFTNLQPLIYDKKEGIELKYLLNRLKMMFDVTIVTETQMEQINVAHYLMNAIRQDHPFFIQVALESFIPKEIINVMAREYGIPIHDANGNPELILNKLNSVSEFPITYKLKKSTGNDEFFMYYATNVDTTFSGIGMDDGEKKGFIFDSFETSFVISTEFFAPGLYFYFTRNSYVLDDIKMQLQTVNPADRIITSFTVSNLFDLRLPEGWTFYATRMFTVDEDSLETGEDIFPLQAILNESITRTIQYHNKNGIPSESFIRIRLMKDNQELKENVGFRIDFKNNRLITTDINLKSTYRIIVYANFRYINELIKREYNLE